MRTIYFDCFAGASGDMIVGALLDLGIDSNKLINELSSLPVSNYEINVNKVEKNGISATRFEVLLISERHGKTVADQEFVEINAHGDFHDLEPIHLEGEERTHHNLNDILNLIRYSHLSEHVKNNAIKIFNKLGEAEAKVHNKSVNEIHLHEVGATDALIDIVSAAICIDWLEVENITISPIHLGSGFIQSAHGKLPVPAPATAELLRNLPVYTTETKGELITPTGAAILSSIGTNHGRVPFMQIESIGYGAGKRDREFPNVLRVYYGESQHSSSSPISGFSNREPFPEQHDSPENQFGTHQNSAVMLEANLDDMNPQLFGHLMEILLDTGALDVAFIPIQMKKNRPAIKLEVMIPPNQEQKYLDILFHETTTIGVRSYPVTKHMLQREIISVQTPYGIVRIKASRLGGKTINLSPEYEDCLVISKKTGIPVKEIIACASASAQTFFSEVGK